MKKFNPSLFLFRTGQFILLQRMFSSLRVKSIHTDELVTIIVNHSNFYDSLVLFELQRKKLLPKKTLAVMNKEGLQQFPLFKSIGILPVSNPMKLSEYKMILSAMKDTNLLIFPEGKENHLEKRPIEIQSGTSALLKKNAHHGLLFVSLYYSFTKGIRAEIVCSMHYVSANKRPHSNLDVFIQKTMEEQLNNIKGDVIEHNYDGYEQIW